jgi:ribonuclease BN (tRNA processing enzyme)
MMIEIKFVGTGTPIIEHTNVRACASEAIIIGEDILLFDCGRFVASQLFRTGIPPYKVTHLFFTHSFHIDHTSDYPSLILSRFHNDKTPLTVYGPPGTEKLTENVFDAFIDERGPTLFGKIEVKDVEEGDITSSKLWNISSVWTNHGQFYDQKSLAYKIVSDNKSIVISGDVGCGRPEVPKSNAYALNENLISLAKNADLFIMDADLMHTTVADIARAAKDSNAKQVVLTHMHLPGWSSSNLSPTAKQGTDDEIIDEIKKMYDGIITIAKDLTSIFL